MLIDFGKKQVLVIDDLAPMRSAIKAMLESFGARQVTMARDGDEALQLLSERAFDYVLCDYNLGAGRDGQQTLEEAKVRGMVGLNSVFIMITAENTSEMVMGAMEYRPDGYLTKPFTKDLLRTRLEQLTERKGSLKPIEEARRSGDLFKAIRICNQMLVDPPTYANDLRKIKAELCIKVGLYGEARQVYEDVLAKRPLAWAECGLGQVLFLQEDYPAALELFQRLAATSNTYLEPHDWLAKTLNQLDQKSAAQEVLTQAAAYSPRAILRQQALADLAHVNGDRETEEQALRKTLQLSRCSIYRRPADYAQMANIEYTRGGKGRQKALMTLKEGERAFRNDPVGGCEIAIATCATLMQTGDTAKARKVFANAVKYYLDQKDDSPSATLSMGLARLSFQFGEQESGMDYIRAVISNQHDNSEVITQLHELFKDVGLEEEGRSLVLEIQQEISALNNKGVKLAKEGHFDAAILLFRNALKRMPANPMINLNAAKAYILAIQKGAMGGEVLPKIDALLRRVQQERPKDPSYIAVRDHYKALRATLAS